MRVRILLVLFAAVLTLLSSCKKQPQLDIREIDFLNKSQQLAQGVHVDAELPLQVCGIINCDSINILVSQDPGGYVFVYSDKWELLGKFFLKGRARNEFVNRPGIIRRQVFLADDRHLLLPLQDETSIKIMDVTQSILSGKSIISQIRDFTPYYAHSFQTDDYKATLRVNLEYLFLDNDINNTLEYIQGFSFDFTDVPEKYWIRHDTTYMELPKVLSDMLTLGGPQHKPQFKRRFYKHPTKNLIVEPFQLSDYIMFYDLDKDLSFGVHQDGSPTLKDEPDEVPHYNDNGEVDYMDYERSCFDEALPFEDYFLVFYYGGNHSLSDPNKDWPRPEVLFFDWDGNFKNSIKLDTYIDYPAFNEKTKTLYGLPMKEEDEIISFDLSPLFE